MATRGQLAAASGLGFMSGPMRSMFVRFIILPFPHTTLLFDLAILAVFFFGGCLALAFFGAFVAFAFFGGFLASARITIYYLTSVNISIKHI